MTGTTTTATTTTERYSNKYSSCAKFTGDNYEQWSNSISYPLDAELAWDIVLSNEEIPLPPASEATPIPGPSTRSSTATLPAGPTAAQIQAYESKLKDFTLRQKRAAAIIYGSVSTLMQAHINQQRDPCKM